MIDGRVENATIALFESISHTSVFGGLAELVAVVEIEKFPGDVTKIHISDCVRTDKTKQNSEK